MPHGLENIIRPFQSPQSHGAIIIASTPSASRERATLTWGAKATMPPVQITDGGDDVACCKEGLTELSRNTETVRITQPGKPENYVDVARAKDVTLRKKEENKCAGDWAQFSGVGAAIDEAFASLEADIGLQSVDGHHCGTKWYLKNNTGPAAAPPA
jgi:hypothetical protein